MKLDITLFSTSGTNLFDVGMPNGILYPNLDEFEVLALVVEWMKEQRR